MTYVILATHSKVFIKQDMEGMHTVQEESLKLTTGVWYLRNPYALETWYYFHNFHHTEQHIPQQGLTEDVLHQK